MNTLVYWHLSAWFMHIWGYGFPQLNLKSNKTNDKMIFTISFILFDGSSWGMHTFPKKLSFFFIPKDMNNNNMRKESVKSSEKYIFLPIPSSHAVSQKAVKQQINVLLFQAFLFLFLTKCLSIFYLKPFFFGSCKEKGIKNIFP